MFTAQELLVLASACGREVEFLRAVESCGIPTAVQQGVVTVLRGKCLEHAASVAKAEQAANAKAAGPQLELVKDIE